MENKTVESMLLQTGSERSVVKMVKGSGESEIMIVPNSEIDEYTLAFFNMSNEDKITVAHLEAKEEGLYYTDYELYMLVGDVIEMIYRQQIEIDNLKK